MEGESERELYFLAAHPERYFSRRCETCSDVVGAGLSDWLRAEGKDGLAMPMSVALWWLLLNLPVHVAFVETPSN